jgi:hypothetical protein
VSEIDAQFIEDELAAAKQRMEEARNTYWMMSGAVQTLTQLLRRAQDGDSSVEPAATEAEIPTEANANGGSAKPAE